MNRHHKDILERIRERSGTPTQHTFLDKYLGNDHPKYSISVPTLRSIAKDWMQAHPELSADALAALLTSLVKGESSTEKCVAGILLDYATPEQRKFDPKLFDSWLDHLEGWVEVDTVCTGKYGAAEIPAQWGRWKKLILKFSKSSNINKRRASLVLCCSPLRSVKDDRLADLALDTVDRLKHEKAILITKAISWVLRSMEKHYRKKLKQYLNKNMDTLPKIAVRETMAKLTTGVKGKASKDLRKAFHSFISQTQRYPL
ncbi:MAG: DNA alkylation repair protein [Cyclobacteriaceae bacterium]|nr:DNA alkylation repair protein [Cyclobacteriaceae bacterium]MDH4298035.1 DNA alkylation repair protein [Cyclobacteriaceae bacterium]MDH5250719.1 DNA alkylation repair protein [Cyclobacteriaceae bacterium]